MLHRRHRGSRDASHKPIAAAFVAAGCIVVDISSLPGETGDLLVGVKGRWVVVEAKNPLGPRGGRRGSKLTREQETFARVCASRALPYFVIRSVGEVGACIAKVGP